MIFLKKGIKINILREILWSGRVENIIGRKEKRIFSLWSDSNHEIFLRIKLTRIYQK